MTTRIYRIADKATNKPRLVRAGHPSTALRHVAADAFEVRVATQDDLVAGFEAGLQIEHGIDDDSAIDLHGCKVDKWSLEPMQGGSVVLSFRVGTSDLDETYAGRLAMKLGQEVQITLLPPEPKADAIDGSVEAFEADHPLFDGDGDEDPADVFAENEAAGLNKDAADVPAPKKRRSGRPSLAVVD